MSGFNCDPMLIPSDALDEEEEEEEDPPLSLVS